MLWRGVVGWLVVKPFGIASGRFRHGLVIGKHANDGTRDNR